MICSVDNEMCSSNPRAIAKGFCKFHYDRHHNNIPFDLPKLGTLREGVCSVEECEDIIRSRGLCSLHYDRLIRGRMLDLPYQDHYPVCVRGPLPEKGQKAIYYLKDQNDDVFYVGSSKKPLDRFSSHRKNHNLLKEMVIVKVVPIGEEVYWESKLLVDLVDIGCTLINGTAPASRGR